jgi:hypothetical protein
MKHSGHQAQAIGSIAFNADECFFIDAQVLKKHSLAETLGAAVIDPDNLAPAS